MTDAADKVAADVADAEFERWAKAMRVNTSVDGLSDDDVKAFEQSKGLIVKMIMRGALVIDGECQAVYAPQTDGFKPLTFHKPVAADLLAWDRYPADQTQHRRQCMIETLTNTATGRIGKLELPDLKDVGVIAGFLLSPVS